MGKNTIDRKLTWYFDESPTYTGWFLVQGKVIVKGKLETTTRVVQYYKISGDFVDNDDMTILCWAHLPETVY